MNIDEARKVLEDRLTVRDGTRSAFCQTGEEYVVFASAGLKPEGESTEFYDTEDLAVRFWLKHALIYKVQKMVDNNGKYIIYYRQDPSVEEHEGKYTVYSRFIITDKEETK